MPPPEVNREGDLLAALFAVYSAEQPADTNHPYGHGKVHQVDGELHRVLGSASVSCRIEPLEGAEGAGDAREGSN